MGMEFHSMLQKPFPMECFQCSIIGGSKNVDRHKNKADRHKKTRIRNQSGRYAKRLNNMTNESTEILKEQEKLRQRKYRELQKTKNTIDQLTQENELLRNQNSTPTASAELTEAEKMKKKRQLLVWNLQTKPSETVEEQEKIKMDIEKLSPCTLTKSCEELNDARNEVTSTLTENQRSSSKRILNVLTSRRERDNRVYETLSPEELELNTLKKAFEYIKKLYLIPKIYVIW